MHCKYLPVVPYKALENFSKALYGTTGRYLQCMHYPSCHEETACFMPQTPPPPPPTCPLSRIMELMFESNPCQRCYPKNWKKNDPCKHWIHVRDLAERLASLCAVVGCLILDVHLLIKSSKYLLHDCAWLIAIQRISDWSKLYKRLFEKWW